MMNHSVFSERLSTLREQAEISERAMSLALHRSDRYIYDIEKNNAYPSLEGFFDICDYLKVTPADFFDLSLRNPARLQEAKRLASGLSHKQRQFLLGLMRQSEAQGKKEPVG